MTITFECDKDVIVYALEKIISFARSNQYIFLAQSVWWISSVIGLQEGLIIHIDNLKVRSDSESELFIQRVSSVEWNKPTIKETSSNLKIHPDLVKRIQATDSDYTDSNIESVSKTESNIHDEIIENCEALLEQSKQERKAIGRKSRQVSRVAKRKNKKLKTFGTQTEGIDGSELWRRKAAGECQRCTWPQNRKGSHKTLDCFRWKRLEKGTAPFPTKKNT
jgi:hypothetical protein